MYMKIHKCRLEEFEGHCGLCILINNINFNFAFTPQWKSKCQNSNETSNNFVQRNIRLIFHFVDLESLPSATLRWLFGSYQSCNNLSTHSIHENFLRFQSCLIFLQVLSLYCIFQERANIAGEWKLWTLHFCCMNKHSSTPSRHSVPKFTEMNP